MPEIGPIMASPWVFEGKTRVLASFFPFGELFAAHGAASKTPILFTPVQPGKEAVPIEVENPGKRTYLKIFQWLRKNARSRPLSEGGVEFSTKPPDGTPVCPDLRL